MTYNFFDLIYLLLVLTGIVILIENRLERVLLLTGLQGFLLAFPVFQVHSVSDPHSWILASMVLVFKTTLTPYVLFWSVKKSKVSVHTKPRFGYLATFFFFIMGLIASLYIVNGLGELPKEVDKIGVIYVFLLIYLGLITFIVRTHWIVLICGFVMIENGIFLLTLILDKGLPFGVEFGAFIDALLVIVAAVALQLRGDSIKQMGVKSSWN
ncbi:MAG TPA: formate hydrogenase [Leptospiraceae bacterium]|nr:formate hydrogenase [Leptospiraceae bacterium]HMW07172.1 formate hydrogenase [Leptospiraceae bacterium]HMX33430.1 formate hydrogenase [Leptospiraceae bacterium]HMY32788.1 formate hydrogenase [Leptospiraceae bacterium]HMZ65033.1 formate hydrogenase [Leptospiraceae bacterium]